MAPDLLKKNNYEVNWLDCKQSIRIKIKIMIDLIRQKKKIYKIIKIY